MKYKIEYTNGRCCKFVEGRKELMKCLKLLNWQEVADIRKVYKNGITDSVMETYRKYI